MSFASPVFLAALALVPLVLAAHVVARRRARRYAVRFPAVATLAPLLPRVSSWRRRLPLALFLAALAALSLALARPQATVAVPQEQASIVLVTDVSRSMLANDVEPSRLEAARSAAQRFLDEVPDAARVGAVAFSSDPHTLEPPTDDRNKVKDLIDSLSADGGTATGDALAAAVDMVDNGPAAKRPPAAIVLLSDGATTTGRDPTEVARAARKLHIPIHTVALGTRGATIETPTGAILPVPPDPETMRRIAELSGGRAFQAEDADGLARIYKGLGSRVASKKEQREITVAFAAGGGLLLAAAAAFGLRGTARLP
ncbi:MAG: Ca-activated chloride channel [Thermoleophilaceae bacterium]|nr:Ca-activated chloride channel [Thermoleophilaceae bacterium]